MEELVFNLIRNTLYIAVVEAGRAVIETVPVAIKAVLEDCLPWLEGSARQHKVTIESEISGDSACLLGDPRRIRQILINLVGNALKRSEEHTSELQSLMRISYAVFCLKKKK